MSNGCNFWGAPFAKNVITHTTPPFNGIYQEMMGGKWEGIDQTTLKLTPSQDSGTFHRRSVNPDKWKAILQAWKAGWPPSLVLTPLAHHLIYYW